MVWPDPLEVAKLIVNGKEYTDWETVMVKHELSGNPAYQCRFTCSEGMPLAQNFAALRIRPGDDCTVMLGGYLAFTGRVELRQVYYDARRHHIEIECSTNYEIYTSSFTTQTHEFKDTTFKKVAETSAKQLGLKFVVDGGQLPDKKIPRVSITPSEPHYDVLDMLARANTAAGHPILLTSNEFGDLVAVVGKGSDSERLIEGIHILEGREQIYNPEMKTRKSIVSSQATGSDQKSGTAVAHEAHHSQDVKASVPEGRAVPPQVIIGELPTADKELLKNRNDMERGFQKNDEITIWVTVRGWMKPSGGLWRLNRNGMVKIEIVSPMLLLKGGADEDLHIHAITFTQSNDTGTRTTIEARNMNAERGNYPSVTPT